MVRAFHHHVRLHGIVGCHGVGLPVQTRWFERSHLLSHPAVRYILGSGVDVWDQHRHLQASAEARQIFEQFTGCRLDFPGPARAGRPDRFLTRNRRLRTRPCVVGLPVIDRSRFPGDGPDHHAAFQQIRTSHLPHDGHLPAQFETCRTDC